MNIALVMHLLLFASDYETRHKVVIADECHTRCESIWRRQSRTAQY